MIIGLEKTSTPRRIPQRRHEFGVRISKVRFMVDGRGRLIRRNLPRKSQHAGADQRHRNFTSCGRGRDRHRARHHGAADRLYYVRGPWGADNGSNRRNEEAILKDIVQLRKPTISSIRTAVVADVAADEAILKELSPQGTQSRRDRCRPPSGRESFSSATPPLALLEKSRAVVAFCRERSLHASQRRRRCFCRRSAGCGICYFSGSPLAQYGRRRRGCLASL